MTKQHRSVRRASRFAAAARFGCRLRERVTFLLLLLLLLLGRGLRQLLVLLALRRPPARPHRWPLVARLRGRRACAGSTRQHRAPAQHVAGAARTRGPLHRRLVAWLRRLT